MGFGGRRGEERGGLRRGPGAVSAPVGAVSAPVGAVSAPVGSVGAVSAPGAARADGTAAAGGGRGGAGGAGPLERVGFAGSGLVPGGQEPRRLTDRLTFEERPAVLLQGVCAGVIYSPASLLQQGPRRADGGHRGSLCLALGGISAELKRNCSLECKFCNLWEYFAFPLVQTLLLARGWKEAFGTRSWPEPQWKPPAGSSCALEKLRRSMQGCAVRSSCGTAPGGTGSSSKALLRTALGPISN